MREEFDYRKSRYFQRYTYYFAIYGFIVVFAVIGLAIGEWLASILALVFFLPALWIGVQRRKVFVHERIVVDGELLEYTNWDGVTTKHQLSGTRRASERMSLVFSCRIIEFESNNGGFRVLGFIENIDRLKKLI
jgi:hypothetical protein